LVSVADAICSNFLQHSLLGVEPMAGIERFMLNFQA